jgi:hypothetical protein
MLNRDTFWTGVLCLLTGWCLVSTGNKPAISITSPISICDIGDIKPKKELESVEIRGRVINQKPGLTGWGLTTTLINNDGCTIDIEGINERYTIKHQLVVNGQLNSGRLEATNHSILSSTIQDDSVECFITTIDNQGLNELKDRGVNLPKRGEEYSRYWNEYQDKTAAICYKDYTILSISIN